MSRENLNEWELIAIAITHAMRDNIEPLRLLLHDLRKDYTDQEIGLMFMEVGAIVFNESELQENNEEENEEE